jgi:hypothetical protein
LVILPHFLTGWPTMPTGAIPTSKNNYPDKKSENNADNNNPYFNADSNNPDSLCKLRSFLKTKLGTKFDVWNFNFQLR